MALDHLLQALRTIPDQPGVYRMVNAQGNDLYIGKAKSLIKRVTSYTHLARLPHRLRQMVHHAVDVRVLVTPTELDALMLEANLIKRYQPPYNILLKHGNRFSYLVLTAHPYPRVQIQRSPETQDRAVCLGPFLSSAPLQHVTQVIHRAFLLRSCSDFVFAHRTRPCLEYHIGRCSAPCVNKIDAPTYGQHVQDALRFLKGHTNPVRQSLQARMRALADQHAYDQARSVRDQIAALDHVSACGNQSALPDGDVVVALYAGGVTCVHVLCVRHHLTYGADSFFFPHTSPADHPEILRTVLMKLYETAHPPHRIVMNAHVQDPESIKMVCRHHFGRVPHIVVPRRGPLVQVLRQVMDQAQVALDRHLHQHTVQEQLWQLAAETLDLPATPQRIEIYDNSHHQGSSATAVMVVASPQGFERKQYRTFSMQHGSDDYAMMRDVMHRRFRQNWARPDLMVIDGGKGQLRAVQDVLQSQGLSDIAVIAIVKATPHDQLLDAQGKAWDLPEHHPVLHLMQRLRDETHRFAVTTHRKMHRRKTLTSGIQALPHIGPTRYRQLMEHFRTPAAIFAASIQDLESLFSPAIARKVHASLQGAQASKDLS